MYRLACAINAMLTWELGSFIALYGIANTRKLIAEALA